MAYRSENQIWSEEIRRNAERAARKANRAKWEVEPQLADAIMRYTATGCFGVSALLIILHVI